MTTPGGTPAGWYPDPHARYEQRWFDGAQWTPHVATRGVTTTESSDDWAYATGVSSSDQVQQQVTRAAQDRYAGAPGSRAAASDADPAGAPAPGGGGTIFTEPVLVVNQKAKVFEVTNEYAVYDQHGRQIGAVRQIGQSAARKVLRVVSNLDQYLTHRLEIVDEAGAPLLRITRPGKILKSKFQVERGDGQPVGEILQENVFGKVRFSLVAGGQSVGSINAENWRAWNFSIRDAGGNEVARITKTWEGFAKAMFTTADNYVVTLHRPLDEPLRSLVVASALSVDTALKQAES
ncbi:phospholipid scramblase-related protein [Iamia sp.]|uniref:phospholipid scramblase-related protein n=1 Tax=Iamia sp. TaxID=2722710 RepID=UPI002BB429CB|nr:phospholipid scramblase-related protein [Iamia sp.]HXH56417.1 phospholipid scramblase-related protein [Iamia sp.]